MPDIARIPFTQFYGGWSKSAKDGIAGSYDFGQSLDTKKDPSNLQVLPKMTQETDVFTDLVLFMDTNTINTNIYAVGSAGAIYKKASGVWSKLATLSGGNGQGLKYFAGTSLYYGVSGDQIFTIDPSNDSISQSLQTLNVATWHSCEVFLDKIFFCNGREITSYDGSGIYATSSITGAGVSLDFGYTTKVVKSIGDFLFIGAEHTNSSKAKWFLFDGTAADYNHGKELGENGICAATVADDGTVIISAGKKGQMYKLSGEFLNPLIEIKNIENDKYAEIYPGAITTFQGKPYFSPSFGDSETVYKGGYSWSRAGAPSAGYPLKLDYEFPSSCGETQGNTLDIGCLFAASTTDLYMSWDNNGVFGMDLMNGSNVYATAIYDTRIFDDNNPFQQKTFLNYKIRLARPLRTGENITLKYKADRASSWTTLKNLTTDTYSIEFGVDGAILSKKFTQSFKATEIQFRLEFTITGSTSPAVDALMAEFTTEGSI